MPGKLGTPGLALTATLCAFAADAEAQETEFTQEIKEVISESVEHIPTPTDEAITAATEDVAHA